VSGLHVIVEADGGSRGNPGPSGYGAVVLDSTTGAVLAERNAAIGVTTNNVAEYSGLIAGLAAAAELGAVEVDVRMDSKLVVEQMAGRWKIKHPGLRPLAAQAATLVRRFDAVRFAWIPRERNKRADALANAAMDAAGPAPEEPAPAGRLSPPLVVDPPAAPSPARSPARSPAPSPVARSWDPPAVAPTRLILVRHGETALTAQRRYSGRSDVPLSERGRAQAHAAASRVAGLLSGQPAVPSAPAAVLLSSPLARCRGTADMVSAAIGDPQVRIESDLIECDFGAWDGLTYAEVRSRWPAELAAWMESPAVAPPGGESFGVVATRIRRLVKAILDGYPGRRVVVVSHVGPIKLILRDALAAGDAFLHRCYLDPAGISLVDTWPDGGVAVRAVNDTAHLAGVG